MWPWQPGGGRPDIVRRCWPAASAVLLWCLLVAPPTLTALAVDPADFRWWELVGPMLPMAAAVALHRRRPLAAVGVAVLLSAVDPWSPIDRFTLAVVVLAYLAGGRPSPPRALWWWTAIAVSGTLVALGFSAERWQWFYTVTVTPVLIAFPWLAARYLRQRRDLMLGGWELARNLEREQAVVADRTRLLERSRIAQDMHDSLGHELSLIALRAAALELGPDLPAGRQADAGELRVAAGEATKRLQEIIGVLRADGGAPVEPVNASIEDLVARAAASGVLVELRRTGEPLDVAPLTGRTAYRIVQESLTNATKHAPGAEITVQVGYRAADVLVTVVNGAVAPAGPPSGLAGGGHGLAGLRERVRLLGGTLAAGPHDGGFRVAATLPNRPAPIDAAAARPHTEPAAETDARQTRAARRARRGSIVVLGLPVAVGVVLAATVAGFLFQMLNSVLPPADFARIEVGQTAAETDPLLPAQELTELPGNVRDRPVPPGAGCHYYLSTHNLLADADVYRVCLAGNRVVSTDVLTPDGRGE
ncbi:sensor histidine kinase [Paractinoplanes rishiriensis]|uniref:histidine kinase n=1 Tax=Paractinoplanes rishiriensis TaxID=1050105 RepID=A0A919K2Z9_9ACTN|nr:histidine kinase [Actinoplanes rishiriensis]GIE99946.1 two-component sensor histidine kinase [Actinoplanes rishiriensis]